MPDYVDLLPSEINTTLCERWNSRKEYPEDTGAADNTETPLTNEQFGASIAEVGVIQAPHVRWMVNPETGENTWAAVYGVRRIRTAAIHAPDTHLHCPVFQPTGNDQADDEQCSFLNLTENLHRRDLQPWEIAETLHDLYQARKVSPSPLTYQDIADRTGLSKSYVSNLVRVREKAHADVWRQFKRWGHTMRVSYNALLKICLLPPDEQLDAWNVALKDAARRKGGGVRGREKRPGPAKLRKLLSLAPSIKGHSQYRRGFEDAIKVALGEMKPPIS